MQNGTPFMAGGASKYARQYNDEEGEEFAQAMGVDADEADDGGSNNTATK